MEAVVLIELLLLILEIGFSISDEASDIIYVCTQDMFDSLMLQIFIFFILASPLVQVLAYTIILGNNAVTSLRNKGFIEPDDEEQESLFQVHIAFGIMILQEFKIFAPTMFWFLKKRYNLVFTKNLMEGLKTVVSQKRKTEQEKREVEQRRKKIEKQKQKEEKERQKNEQKKLQLQLQTDFVNSGNLFSPTNISSSGRRKGKLSLKSISEKLFKSPKRQKRNSGLSDLNCNSEANLPKINLNLVQNQQLEKNSINQEKNNRKGSNQYYDNMTPKMEVTIGNELYEINQTEEFLINNNNINQFSNNKYQNSDNRNQFYDFSQAVGNSDFYNQGQNQLQIQRRNSSFSVENGKMNNNQIQNQNQKNQEQFKNVGKIDFDPQPFSSFGMSPNKKFQLLQDKQNQEKFECIIQKKKISDLSSINPSSFQKLRQNSVQGTPLGLDSNNNSNIFKFQQQNMGSDNNINGFYSPQLGHNSDKITGQFQFQQQNLNKVRKNSNSYQQQIQQKKFVLQPQKIFDSDQNSNQKETDSFNQKQNEQNLICNFIQQEKQEMENEENKENMKDKKKIKNSIQIQIPQNNYDFQSINMANNQQNQNFLQLQSQSSQNIYLSPQNIGRSNFGNFSKNNNNNPKLLKRKKNQQNIKGSSDMESTFNSKNQNPIRLLTEENERKSGKNRTYLGSNCSNNNIHTSENIQVSKKESQIQNNDYYYYNNNNYNDNNYQNEEHIDGQLGNEAVTYNVSDQEFKKNLILYLDSKMEPDLEIILNDENFKHLMLIGNIFETVFEGIPQAILQFINNQMLLKQRNDGSGWSYYQIFAFTTTCISLVLNCVRLVHLLLGDKLDIFLGTLNYLNKDRNFIKDELLIPERIDVHNDLVLLKKLSLIDENFESEMVQEIKIVMENYKNSRDELLHYIKKIVQKKFPSNFKRFTLVLPNSTIDSTYAFTFEKQFRKAQGDNDNIIVEIEINDHYFPDQVTNKDNEILYMKSINDFLSLLNSKQKKNLYYNFYDRIKNIKLEIFVNKQIFKGLNLDPVNMNNIINNSYYQQQSLPEKLKKLLEKIKKIENIGKLHFPQLETLEVVIDHEEDFKFGQKLVYEQINQKKKGNKFNNNNSDGDKRFYCFKENLMPYGIIFNWLYESISIFKGNHLNLKNYSFEIFGIDLVQVEEQKIIEIDNPKMLQFLVMSSKNFIQDIERIYITLQKNEFFQYLLYNNENEQDPTPESKNQINGQNQVQIQKLTMNQIENNNNYNINKNLNNNNINIVNSGMGFSSQFYLQNNNYMDDSNQNFNGKLSIQDENMVNTDQLNNQIQQNQYTDYGNYQGNSDERKFKFQNKLIENLLKKLCLRPFNKLKNFHVQLEDYGYNLDMVLYNLFKLNQGQNKHIWYFPQFKDSQAVEEFSSLDPKKEFDFSNLMQIPSYQFSNNQSIDQLVQFKIRQDKILQNEGSSLKKKDGQDFNNNNQNQNNNNNQNNNLTSEKLKNEEKILIKCVIARIPQFLNLDPIYQEEEDNLEEEESERKRNEKKKQFSESTLLVKRNQHLKKQFALVQKGDSFSKENEQSEFFQEDLEFEREKFQKKGQKSEFARFGFLNMLAKEEDIKESIFDSQFGQVLDSLNLDLDCSIDGVKNCLEVEKFSSKFNKVGTIFGKYFIKSDKQISFIQCN
ncbi:hypothetical protein PPERSA_01446 [Pseudocohnilembus persalinus]|uniref:Transmembrane protein n=1 Tax=Pseudocohnilembus persalinus TaxID=266149 RepID=A0A0V0QH57_PSEPJ|nr:hypothetical protein PPERSA_01446 [Pseudocohnilembus persalinus]|eukprot:KRX01543.1 hypothetical protein PPERSA_01446 [Pseudocohnilembus persalinus]